MSSSANKRKILKKYDTKFKRLHLQPYPNIDNAGPSENNNKLFSTNFVSCSDSTSDSDTDDSIGDTFLDVSQENVFDASDLEQISEIETSNTGPQPQFEPQFLQNSSNNEASENSFPNELAQWSLEFNIPHNALSSLLNVLLKHGIKVPKDPRTLLKTPRSTGTMDLKAVHPGSYIHFGLKKSILKLIEPLENNNSIVDNMLYIQVNIDGLPISKSSGNQLWPVMISTFYNKNIEIVGIYQGNEKPKDSNVFLKDFVDEALLILSHGINYLNKTLNIKLVFICDVPAKSFIKCTKGHSGYMSCSKCNTEGIFKNNRICFPQISNFNLRTDASFRTKEQESHHNETSILEKLPGLNMIDDFPLDYMHLVCLGVVKKLIVNLWISGKPPYKWSSRNLEIMSSMHQDLQKQIPQEFSRRPRSFIESKRWKATEYRMFLYYTGPVVLKNNVSEEVYANFLCLHVAMTLLSKCQDIHYADELLVYFVKTFIILYGAENVSHNIHNLLHITADSKKFCNIENFSAFKFENNMMFLKKLLRKGNQPLQQIANRLEERDKLFKAQSKSETFPQLKFQHFQGPLLHFQKAFRQYKHIILSNFCLSLDETDNCCFLADDSVVIIRNIVSSDQDIKIIGQKFLTLENFFTSPCNSSELNIFLASNFSSSLQLWDISDVKSKCVKMKYNSKYVIYPLLHTQSEKNE